MYIGEKDVNVGPLFKYGNRFVGVCRFNRVKSGRFNHFNGVQTDQQFIFDDEDYGPPSWLIHVRILCLGQDKAQFNALFRNAVWIG